MEKEPRIEINNQEIKQEKKEDEKKVWVKECVKILEALQDPNFREGFVTPSYFENDPILGFRQGWFSKEELIDLSEKNRKEYSPDGVFIRASYSTNEAEEERKKAESELLSHPWVVHSFIGSFIPTQVEKDANGDYWASIKIPHEAEARYLLTPNIQIGGWIAMKREDWGNEKIYPVSPMETVFKEE